MMPYIIILLVALFIAIIAYSLSNENKIVEKAEKSESMFNVYYILAVMTSSKYHNNSSNDGNVLDGFVAFIFVVGLVILTSC